MNTTRSGNESAPALPSAAPARWRAGWVWVTLAAPPVVFLLLIVVFSVYFGFATQGDAGAIAERVPQSMPCILLAAQIILLAILMGAVRADGLTLGKIGWRLPPGSALWQEMVIGGMVGLAIGILYPLVLSPLLAAVQRTLGDYVPPERIIPSLGTALILFFFANVVLAPFVEESLYRGYAITRLGGRFGTRWAAVIACVFFAALHWTGGFWYVVLTGIAAGIPFTLLFLRRRGIVSAFAAHLTLNLVEFIFVSLSR